LVAPPKPAVAAPSHPFILWTKDDAAAIRKLIENEAWAKRELERMFADDPGPERRRTIDNLFRYAVLDDKACVPVETELLREFIGAPPFMRDAFDWMWHHVDHFEMALRFDTLYDELSPGIRRAVEGTLRTLARWGIEQEQLRGWDGYPRLASHYLCALATGDKRLIQGIFESPGGLKDLLDNLLDGHFTPGMGNPPPKNLGSILLWCRGCQRGLP
jgi:hypothetical protein